MSNRFGVNGHNPDPKATFPFQAKLTEKQWYYVKSRALLENKDMQMIVRELINKAYENELKNGVDVVALAIDNGLL